MTKLTKETYEKLKAYEKHLRAAYKNSYVRMTAAEFAKVAEIYTEVTGITLRKSQMGCNTCRLNTLRKLGEMYEAYEESHKEEPEEKKVKKGRPKKLEEEK